METVFNRLLIRWFKNDCTARDAWLLGVVKPGQGLELYRGLGSLEYITEDEARMEAERRREGLGLQGNVCLLRL